MGMPLGGKCDRPVFLSDQAAHSFLENHSACSYLLAVGAGIENALTSASQSFFPNFRHPDLMMQVQKEGVKTSEPSLFLTSTGACMHVRAPWGWIRVFAKKGTRGCHDAPSPGTVNLYGNMARL